MDCHCIEMARVALRQAQGRYFRSGARIGVMLSLSKHDATQFRRHILQTLTVPSAAHGNPTNDAICASIATAFAGSVDRCAIYPAHTLTLPGQARTHRRCERAQSRDPWAAQTQHVAEWIPARATRAREACEAEGPGIDRDQSYSARLRLHFSHRFTRRAVGQLFRPNVKRCS
jgi:hypothetical protein